MKSKPCLLVGLLSVGHFCSSQTTDSTKKKDFQFAASALVTNNGISLVPTFSLGEPAAIFNIYMGRRFSFEPDLRFSLEGKPWSMLFWFRYRLVEKQRFRFIIGAHPAMNFRTIPAVVNGDTIERIVARRYVAGELSPNYLIAKNVTIGLYYLYSHGVDREAVRNTHFLTLNTNISNINLPWQLYLRVTPQVYYLRQNQDDGFYATSTFVLARKRFPISIMSIMNKTIETDIPASKDFVWNICVIYSFSKNYVEK